MSNKINNSKNSMNANKLVLEANKKQSHKKIIIIAIIVIVVLIAAILAGIYIYKYFSGEREVAPEGEGEGMEEQVETLKETEALFREAVEDEPEEPLEFSEILEEEVVEDEPEEPLEFSEILEEEVVEDEQDTGGSPIIPEEEDID